MIESDDKRCWWCREPIPPWLRSDAECCSKACRQRRHRFRVSPAGETAARPMRFAYADPPYPGLARKYYDCDEVDHLDLIGRLRTEYPDGWALSTSEDALPSILHMIVDSQLPGDPTPRVCAWVKGSRRGVSFRARNAWEPLIVVGGRPVEQRPIDDLEDVLIWGGRQSSHPGALVGMKSAVFGEWMFRQLGAQRGDTLDDLFVGSGIIGRAWDLYQREPSPVDDERLASRLAGATRRMRGMLAELRDVE